MLNCGYLQVCVDGMSLPFSELSYTFLPCVYLQAHCYYVVLKSFNDAIEAKGMSPANEEIMRKLCSLYAMYWMVQNSGEFMAVSESHKQYEIVCCDSMCYVYECYISLK